MRCRARPARDDDAAAIARIYNEGIEDRVATFETRGRSAADVLAWLAAGFPLVVVEEEGEVVAWASAPPYSDRQALRFREVGVYRRHARLDGEWRDCVIVERLLSAAGESDAGGAGAAGEPSRPRLP